MCFEDANVYNDHWMPIGYRGESQVTWRKGVKHCDKQTYMDALGEINLRKEWSVGQIFLSYLLWSGEKIGNAQTSRIQWRRGSYAAGASVTLAEIRTAIMGGRDAGTLPDKS